jgi:predicted GTPase
MQILATKAGLQPTFKNIQKNILGWLYTAYLQELGRYLIELNSGRLKVGAKRYRELRDQLQEPPSADGPAIDPAAGKSADRITIAIVGPTKAGKSSLANALLGEERAAVDVVPLTATTTRYDLTQPGLPGLTLLDTVGFAQDGATDADLAAAVDVAASADILLLVAPARSAARVPEVEFLQRLVQQFEARPELKLPPVLLALTKIDLLPPAIEWQPPYEWQSGSRPKEVAVRDAINAAKELFPTQIIECVPLCTATGKVHGVRETLLPLLAAQLSEARGVAMLRMLHAEGSADQVQRLIGQAVNVGKELFRQWWRPGKV